MNSILCSWCHSPAVMLCLDGDQCCAASSCIAKYRAEAEPVFERDRYDESVDDTVRQIARQVAAVAPKYGGVEALKRRLRLHGAGHLRVVR